MNEQKQQTSQHSWKDPALSLGIACLLAIPFIPSLLLAYGHSDDYPRLLVHLLELRGFLDSELTLGGRPISAILIKAGFSSIDSVGSLALLRCVSLFCWILLTTLVHQVCRWNRLSLNHSTLLTLAICMSPAMVVFLGWTSAFPYPLGAALAILAGHLSVPGDRNLIRSTGPLFLSLMVYQPVAAYFWIPVILQVWRKPSPSYRDLLIPFIRYSGTLGIYWVGLLLFWKIQPGSEAIVQRIGFFEAWGDKFYYLSTVLIPDITGGWLVFLHPWLGGFVVLAVLINLLLMKREKAAVLSALTMMALGFAILPALISSENLRGFRLEGPAQAILWMLILPLGGMPHLSRNFILPLRVTWILTGALSATAAYASAWWGMSAPQHDQWNRHLGQMSLRAYNEAPYIVYRTPLQRHEKQFWSRHEFGLISSSLPWVCGSMFPLAVVESGDSLTTMGRREIFLAQKTIPWPAWQPYPPDAVVIDGKKVLSNAAMPPPKAFKTENWANPPRLNKTDNTFGEIRILHDNWYFDSDLGPLKIIGGKLEHGPFKNHP